MSRSDGVISMALTLQLIQSDIHRLRLIYNMALKCL